jgi:cytochrome P450
MPTTPAEERTFPIRRECPFEPPAAYGEWRDAGMLTKVRLPDGSDAWIAARHSDVREVLNNPSVTADKMNPKFPQLRSGVIALSTDSNLEFMDEPDHGKYRRMLSPDFTAKKVNTMRPGIERIVDDVVTQMLDCGSPADLHHAFSLPIPSLVICELLGVPYADHGFFQGLTGRMLETGTSREVFVASLQELDAYLTATVKAKDKNPSEDDLIGRMIIEHVRTGEVSYEQVVGFSMLMLVAGHETTANQISMGTLSLLREPDKAHAIRQDPKLLPGAVEEMLRIHSITDLVMLRLATEDIEIAGCPIKAGEGIIPLGAAANHDPAVYLNPTEFDPGRGSRNHLTFGFGMHSCIGQNLARAEMEIAFTALLNRIPALRLQASVDELEFKRDGFVFGVYGLPVAW